MSIWTQVKCEVIVPRPVTEEELVSVFGKELDDGEYPSWSEVSMGRMTEQEYDKKLVEWTKQNEKAWAEFKDHEDEYLPTGSEGSLHYGKCCRAARKTEDGRYRYTFGGGLRDYSDDEGIVKWFRRKFLKWCVDSDIDTDFHAYGLVKASMGVGESSWEYGPRYLPKKAVTENDT